MIRKKKQGKGKLKRKAKSNICLAKMHESSGGALLSILIHYIYIYKKGIADYSIEYSIEY